MKFQDLLAYQKSFAIATHIFEITKTFPKEEIMPLTDQIRRSSRSVPANLAEAYQKRIYPKSFQNKLTDADAENSETQVWLAFALQCDYIDQNSYGELLSESEAIGKLHDFEPSKIWS